MSIGAAGARATAAIVLRVAAALLGNYVATIATASLLAIALAAGGMGRVHAVVLASICAILAYLVVLIWAFHTPRLGRLWVMLISVTTGGTALARWLGPAAP